MENPVENSLKNPMGNSVVASSMAEAADKTTKRTLDKACEICGRSFARNEHLIRHRRTHTSERPFSCPDCHVTFPRADIKEKHMKRFHPAGGQDEPLAKRMKSIGQARSKMACDQCRKRKLKCDDQRPCKSCCTKELPCTVSINSKRPGRPKNQDATSLIVDSNLPHNIFDMMEVSGLTQPWLHPGSSTSNSIPFAAQDSSISDLQTNLLALPTDPTATTDGNQQQSHGLSNPGNITLAMTADPLITQSNFLFEGSADVDQAWGDFMDPSWQLPPLGVENWLDDLDDSPFGDALWLQALPMHDGDNVSHMDDAITIMRDHYHRRSGASSPNGEGTRQLWYSAPPRLQMYDKDVLNVLLNLTQRNISGTFRVFSTFEYNCDTNSELCLAMAAVGGLFSTTFGSTAVAKSLYNDARRMHFEKLFGKELSSFESSVSSMKTSILLEIYGLCSGDKRSYEFVEAFHYNTLQSMALATRLSSDGPESEEHRHKQLFLLSEALEVLESYRVLLLLLPPCFPEICEPRAAPSYDPHWGAHSSSNDLASLMTPNAQIDPSCADLRNIASISTFCWMSSPRGQESLRRRRLWSPEFVELSLQKWMDSEREYVTDTKGLDVSQALLYHLASLNNYLNIGMLLRYSHHYTKRSKIPSDNSIVESVRQYIAGPDYKVARWHAEIMIQLIKKTIAIPYRLNQAFKEKQNVAEPPHLPYCIYFATLIIWCGEAEESDSHSSKSMCIENGLHLLRSLKVRVSRVLGGALYEVFSEGQRNQVELEKEQCIR